ncbi:MAG: hypothetical protein G3H99_00220 [Ferrovum sp.]|nr:hypothetical protein [Ferrovum sp.]NDU87663.1 hypothetical protein [Ferrovum sp.]
MPTTSWRASMGIVDSLIRFSIGIEDYGDLVGDFDQALNIMGA